VMKCLFELRKQRFLLDEDVIYLLRQASRLKYWDD
jgi:hypothetical protein